MRFDKKNGFTLIELLIVVAITGIMSSFAVINFSVNSQRRDLANEALKVLDGLKQTQTLALSGQQNNGLVTESYKFKIGACESSACSYNIIASSTPPTTMITQALTKSSISNAVEITFKIPRGDIISPISQTIITISHKNSSSLKSCIKIESVSGKMEIITCP